ncbi:hypothetical protein GCM10010174_63220 [Kutzneria viridogrisea]|uniref:BON domain-containing protein n=1 Tax=Kutzneria viridogrisea TaxID=47990 RepID=A0ABR6BFV7_9PSEU|nr:hypothetical protein [Kutzneria viridogrisea]
MHPWTARWLTGAVAVPAVLAVVGVAAQGAGIEEQVLATTRGVLASGGQAGATAVVSGRDVTLSGVPYERIADTVKAVGAVDRVGSVVAREPRLSPLKIDVTDQHVVVTGTTQQEAWRQRFVRAVAEYSHGRELVDHTSTAQGADFAMTTTAAAALVSVLTVQPGAEVSVSAAEGRVQLDGVMPDDARRANTVDLLTRLFGAGVVVDKTHVQGSPR